MFKKKWDIMFDRYSRNVQKHPKAVIAVWLVLLLVAAPFMVHAEDVLIYDITGSGGFDSEATEGRALADQYFSSELSTDAVIVIPYSDDVSLGEIESKLVPALVESVDEALDGIAECMVMGSFGNGSDSGVYMVSVVFADFSAASDHVGTIRDAVSDAKKEVSMQSFSTYVTGSAPITYDTMAGANADVAKIDPLSVLIILLLLGLFFWTLVSALVPPLVVGAAYGVVLALIYLIGGVFDVFYITKTIVLVSMLGAGCDYSIFIVSRYREERKAGKEKSDAIAEAVKWAGESVFTSGLAVVIGFAVMSLCSFSLVSTMAIVLALGIVMAMIGALTLIPAVLTLLGDKVFAPRSIDFYKAENRKGAYGRVVKFSKRYFSAAVRFSVKHAKTIVAAAILLTVPLGYVAINADDSFDMVSVMPDSEAREGVYQITSHTDGGILMPTYVLIHLDGQAAEVTPISGSIGSLKWTDSFTSTYGPGVAQIESQMTSADPNIGYVLGPTSWEAAFDTVRAAIAAQAGVDPSLVPAEDVNRVLLDQFPDTVGLALKEKLFGVYGWGISPSDYLWTVVFDAARSGIAAQMGVPESMVPASAVNQYIVSSGMLGDSTQTLSQAFEAYGWDLEPGTCLWTPMFNAARAGIAAQMGVPASMVPAASVNQYIVSSGMLGDSGEAMKGLFDAYGWDLEPAMVEASVPGLPTPASTVGYTVANVVDYAVNIGASLVSDDGTYLQLMVVVKDEPMSVQSMNTVPGIREALDSFSAGNQWMAETWVTGTCAILYDISEVVDNEFILIEIGVVLLIVVLLFFVLGSYLTPLRSVLTIMMSVVWTLGLVQLVFVKALEIDVVWMVPIILFVICLGLGMDYDILLTTRIREGKLRGLSNDDAIVASLERSGPIISLCGLIMGGTFLTLLLSGSAMLQEVGFALGVGILIDSLVVVPYVVPALMHLMGEWSWKGPAFLNRHKAD